MIIFGSVLLIIGVVCEFQAGRFEKEFDANPLLKQRLSKKGIPTKSESFHNWGTVLAVLGIIFNMIASILK